MKVGIIPGSTRDNRKSIIIATWLLEQSKSVSNDFEIVDIKEYNLPHYNEPSSPRSNPNYTHETTRRWSERVKQFDAFIFVTPEYNGFITGALKDSIDYLYHEWFGKPFAIVGYGGRGAKWASEMLEKLLKRFEMDFKGYVGLLKPWDAISKDGTIDTSFLDGDVEYLLKQFKQRD